MIDPLEIIKKYYEPGTRAYRILLQHSELVAEKAFELAKRNKHLQLDVPFIKEAALLHDIGIFKVQAPGIGCNGEHPYICHGYLGREILEKEGLPLHALVCERHTGVGLSIADIEKEKMPLPLRDMQPQTYAEKVICLADNFFSKNPAKLHVEKSVEIIREEMARFGKEKLLILDTWLHLFGIVK